MVFFTPDIRAHIHYNIEELGGYKLSCVLIEKLITNNQLKLNFAHLQRKGFTQFMDFRTFDEVEWVLYVLSHIHVEFIQLDQSYKITEEVIKNVTCLHKVGGVPDPRCNLSNIELNKLTGDTFDGRSMRVDDVRDIDVKFSAMIIGYKVYQSNRLNFVSGNNILVAHQMVKEDAHYDLCSIMLEELMTNLQKIKQDKKNTFQYGSFVICLVFYFLGTVPDSGKVQWAFD